MNFRLGSSHHTCNGDGTKRIGDQQHGFIEFSLDIVQGGHLLARPGFAHNNDWFGIASFFSSLDQQIVVECMQWLAPFEHDIVSDIYDVTDGTHTSLYEPILHPSGRFAELHIFDYHTDIAIAQFRI